MDIRREGTQRRKWIQRTVMGIALLCGIPLATWGVSRLKPAVPSVERATLLIDTVKRGPLLLEVRGLGTFVPEEILQIGAATDGRVEKRNLLPGSAIHPDTVIMELSNPDLEFDASDAEWQLKAAQATYRDLKVKLETQGLEEESKVAQVESDFVKAKMQAERDAELFKLQLAPDLTARQSKATADELDNRRKIEGKILGILGESLKAQLDVQAVQIDKLRAAYDLKRKQVDQLKVRAGIEGVLQLLSVEVGQRVTAGTQLARVAQPQHLKAELKISETQAKDILLGQKAEIDTRNGVVPGHVVRIDPAVVNGTVTVDVKVDGPLPSGARPDLSVDGTIQLERLADVLYIGRPISGQPNGSVQLFKVDADGKDAERVKVQFGHASVNAIEVRDGLKLGDQVILSDMTAVETQNRIRIN